MKTIVILLLMALSVCDATFQRPWQNQTWVSTNPYISIYGYELWFGLPGLHQTIRSVDNASLGALDMNADASRHLRDARRSMSSAQKDLDGCLRLLAHAAVGLPSSPVGSAANAFLGAYYCTSYQGAWKGSVDSILSTIEDGIKEADASVASARSSYEELRFSGICDSNYTYGGGESCVEFSSAFSSVDQGALEGKYGKYALLQDYSSSLGKELHSPAPDLALSSQILGLVWTEGGIIDSFHGLQEQANHSKKSAETDFGYYSQLAVSKKSALDARLIEMKAQRLDLMDRAPSSTFVNKPGAISERFATFGGSAARLSKVLDDARLQHGRINHRGYLASSIMLAAGADSSYSNLLEDLEALEGDAKETLEQQRAEAEGEIMKTENHFRSTPPSPEASTLLKSAKESYATAPGLGSMGLRFSSYSHAAALAREAMNSRSYQDEAAMKASLAELEALIARAEADKINVISEKESLSMLKGMTSSDITPYIKEAIFSIVSKAKDRYDDRLSITRSRIYDKLSLAGPDSEGIASELSGLEEGIVDDGGVIYPEAIGHLAKLESVYATIEMGLDARMSEIVGNSMSISASPLVSDVRLDEPSEISLDLVLSNNRNYSASQAEVRILVDSQIQFLYSEIMSGKDQVESVRYANGAMMLVLKDVKPYETRRVVFRKQSILAHSLSNQAKVDGLGNDAVHISSTIEFDLDCDVHGLSIPEGEVLIDGLSPERPLEAGKHTMTLDTSIEDAYTESIEHIRATMSGMNSRVSYDIVINPKMDINSLPILIDSINDSRMSSFLAVSATGERLEDQRQVSETQFALTALNLKKGKIADVAVSYAVEHADAYVASQISILDKAVLSVEARSILDEAKARSDSGDYQGALELIEKAKSAQKDFDKEMSKKEKQFDELSNKAQDEINEIKTALDGSERSNSSFITKLETRKNELEKALNTTADAGLDEKVVALQKTGSEWLDKEIGSLKKDAYTQYNDLKERFFNAGNISTPQEFLDFESALNKLETGGKLEYGLEALSKLDAVRSVVLLQESRNASGKENLSSVLIDLKESVSGTMERYNAESTSAKGTEFSNLFSENEKAMEKSISDEMLYATSDPKRFWLKADEINRSNSKMQSILYSLKTEAEGKLSVLEGLFSQKELDDSKKKEMSLKIDAARGMITAGQYVDSLRACSAIVKELDSIKPRDNSGLMVLGLTALAVLGGIGFYISKQPKEEKKPRKLQSMSDPLISAPQQEPSRSEPQ